MRSPELISFPLALVPCPSHIAQRAYQHQCHQQSQPHLKPAESVQLLLHGCTDAHTEQYFSQPAAVRSCKKPVEPFFQCICAYMETYCKGCSTEGPLGTYSGMRACTTACYIFRGHASAPKASDVAFVGSSGEMGEAEHSLQMLNRDFCRGAPATRCLSCGGCTATSQTAASDALFFRA